MPQSEVFHFFASPFYKTSRTISQFLYFVAFVVAINKYLTFEIMASIVLRDFGEIKIVVTNRNFFRGNERLRDSDSNIALLSK